MAFQRKTYTFPDAIEVEEYHRGRYGAPGMHRKKKTFTTPEQIARRNAYNKTVRCRRKLRAHFRKNDLFVTLTYKREERPADMAQAKKEFREFMKRIRKAYRRAGKELKWICNIENGTKGAWHVHLVVNRIPDAELIITEAWQHGMVDMRLIDGDMAKLAPYLTKEPCTEKRIRESSYSSSRNLPIPEPKVKEIFRPKIWRGDIKIPRGYYLDKESVVEGINPVTQHPYRLYTLLRC